MENAGWRGDGPYHLRFVPQNRSPIVWSQLRIVSDTSCGLLTSIMPIVTLGRLGSSSIGSYLTLGMVGQLIVTFFDVTF